MRIDWSVMEPFNEDDGTLGIWISLGFVIWFEAWMSTDGWVWEWTNNWVVWREV